MARQPRFVLPGQPQHVIQRGNNRDIIFVSDMDYQFYLEKLGDVCRRFQCQLHAYVLMTNHVHLLITPQTEKGISQVMQSLGRYYVQYFNFIYKRTGTLWEGRYKASLIDAERYLMTCYRYIELNPVRAGMVLHPADYRWSSYQHNAMGRLDPLISEHELYGRLARNAGKRRNRYAALFKSAISDTDLETIREATNKAWVLGNDRFKERIEQMIGRQAKPKPRGGDRKNGNIHVRTDINRV